MSEVKILKEEKINGSITAFEIEPPFPLPENTRFGIDPGTTNMGLAILYPNSVQLYKIKMIRLTKALDRMLEVQQMLTRCIGWFGHKPSAIIEGASFGGYRQVELAEIRAAIALWFHHHKVPVDIVPPKRIRKASFGNGNIKNPWDNLDDDLAASLGCAYYSVNISTISSTETSLSGK
jgi:hypothetical protein